ncbi:hypothetical protein BGW36DRAFT_366649 [Talaromyces proteolyticus]|uniref:Zinc-ribbon domain-containing protein n=1 Tax=Talaromyces proteolyticus TaxID=1131652 RepID=A0AAD4Q5W8_9EURO|nr:uncharacterized protein BGW36DRAFT_366649 [Talaromyces proteolyticus]KAH8705013.1 hypothetical protein BGW36DRAFT_366649 [Talaromyces proteolyticus]
MSHAGCPKCGAAISGENKSCSSCGAVRILLLFPLMEYTLIWYRAAPSSRTQYTYTR